jgi:hypothetical protein
MAKAANYVYELETGEPFKTGNATILGPDGSTLATPALNGTTGRWLYQANGQPGIIKQTYDAGGQVKVINGDAYGQTGYTMLGELDLIMRLFSSGVFEGMTLSAPGGMSVRVAIGLGLNYGVLHPLYTAEDVTIGAAHATLSRIDRIVSRLTRTGTFAGKVALAVVAGTAAASPVAPALTNTADTWEFEIGRVTVPAAASSISSGNLSVANQAVATGPITAGGVGTTQLADGSVTTPKLADGAVTGPKMADGVLQKPRPGFIANYWYSPRSWISSSVVFFNVVSTGQMFTVPIYIPDDTTVTGLGMNIASTTGSVSARLGLYRLGDDGIPTTLVVDGGLTASSSTTGAKTVTVSAAVTAGWYGVTLISGGFAYNLYGMTAAVDPLGSPSAGSILSVFAFIASQSASVAMPDTHPSVGVTTSAPIVWIRTSGS